MKTKNLAFSNWENFHIIADKVSEKEPGKFLMENLGMLTRGNKPLRVFDLACGDGMNTLAWAHGNNIICCNDAGSSILRKIQKVAMLNNPLLFNGDFTNLNLTNNQFDVIQCFDKLSQMQDIEVAIKRMVDLAKRGGKIIFNVLTPNDNAFTTGEYLNQSVRFYKNSKVSFFNFEEIYQLLPNNVTILKNEIRNWQTISQGKLKNDVQKHEAIFFILKKIRNVS